MDQESFQLLHQIKVIQWRRSMFIYTFSLLVILPTCVAIVATLILPWLAMAAVGQGMKDAGMTPGKIESWSREVDQMNRELQKNFKK